MRQSSKAALGGIISALSVVVMLCTYISPFLVYTAPAFAGILLVLIVKESGYKWSIGTYFCVSLLSLFIIADKEAAVFYIMLFGYYPVLSLFLNDKIRNKIIRFLIKLCVFNGAVFVAVFLCSYFFGISYDDLYAEGAFYILAFMFLLNVLLVIFDVLIDRLCFLYIKKLQKKFRKMFNIR